MSCHVSLPDRHSVEINVTFKLNKTYTYLKPNLQEPDPTHSQPIMENSSLFAGIPFTDTQILTK